MNEPIISPWLIYWAGRLDFIQGICCIVGLFVTIYAVMVTIASVTDVKDKETAKAAKIIVCTALILDMLGGISPDRKRNICYVCCTAYNASRHQSNRRIYRQDCG